MGQKQTRRSVNFEDIQYIIKNNIRDFIIINTLNSNEQRNLIKGTIDVTNEERIINENLKNNNLKIIVYGRNNEDISVDNKYNQLITLGLGNVYVYRGGLFEWMMLGDIYGNDEFPTTDVRENDILKYKSSGILTNRLLIN